MRRLIFMLLLNGSLLFSPSPKAGTTDPNGRWVSLSPHAGFFLNPDTYGFIFPAINPRLLLEYRAQRQNRPLFILAGSAVGYSITILTWPFHTQLLNWYAKFWRGIYSKDKILLVGNFYAGFILLNMVVLWVALFLFERVFYMFVRREALSTSALYLLMVFVASNPITKAFFWTVHQELFALMTPLLCVYLLFRFSRLEERITFKMAACMFLLTGLLLLVYGNFLLVLPCLIFCFFFQEKRFGHVKALKTLFLKISLLILLSFIPTICWIGILRWNGIGYYNFEISQFHQFVWMPDTLFQGTGLFFQRLRSFTYDYFLTMKQILILAGFTIVILLTSKKIAGEKTYFIRLWLFVFSCFFLFYWLLGSYEERLSNTLIPLIVCFWVIVLGQNVTQKKTVIILGSLALVWHGYILLSYGPFS
jgi:hypothetical protein